MPAPRPPRRLSRDARREQLVAAATPVVADQGFADLSLEDVAARADVTRNLLYHYFPRGRADIAAAVVERAGHELSDDWEVDESLPLADRLAVNFARMADHALAPSDAWRVYRRARAADDPALQVIAVRYTDSAISSISLNHLGTREPPARVHLALTAFVAFAETALDEARLRHVPREAVMQLLSDSLVAVIAAATANSA